MGIVVLGVDIYLIKLFNNYVVYSGILMVMFYVVGLVGVMKSIKFFLDSKEVY